MSAVIQIAWKDIKQRLRDRSAYVIGVIAPLGLALIIGNLVGGVTEGEALKLAAVDDDGGPVAAAFLDILEAYEHEGDVALTLTDQAGVEALIKDEDYAAAFVFPAGFSEAVVSGGFAEITVVGNPTQTRATEVAGSLAAGFADNLRAIRLAVGTAIAASDDPPTPEALGALAAAAAEAAPPITLTPVEAGYTGIDLTSYYAAGMMVFFLFFIVQFGILSLMEEREQGTLARLLAAPIRPISILMGKALGSFAIGLVSVVVMVVGSALLLDVKWGDSLGVALLALAGVLVAVGLVTLISSIVRTPEAARSYSDMAAVVLGLLGGSFFAVGLSTGFASKITWISPHRWLLEGFRDLNAGDSATDVLPFVGVLLLIAIVVGGIGLLRSSKLVRLS
jgi:ABC-2 type transport system permease protein